MTLRRLTWLPLAVVLGAAAAGRPSASAPPPDAPGRPGGRGVTPPGPLGAPQENGPAPAAREAGRGLSSLQRRLHAFDFEEAELAPYTMPFNFYRDVAPDRGFPQFGRMALTRQSAHTGRWSFMFDIDRTWCSPPTGSSPATAPATWSSSRRSPTRAPPR